MFVVFLTSTYIGVSLNCDYLKILSKVVMFWQGPARAVHVPAAVCAHQLGGHPGRQVGPQRPGKFSLCSLFSRTQQLNIISIYSRVGEYLGYCIWDTQITAFFRNCIVTEIHFQIRESIVTWGYLRVGKVTILLSKCLLADCWPSWLPSLPQSSCQIVV